MKNGTAKMTMEKYIAKVKMTREKMAMVKMATKNVAQVKMATEKWHRSTGQLA